MFGIASLFCGPGLSRNVWRSASRDRILKRITDGDLRDDLISAGLAGGNGERLATTVARYDDFVGRMR